MKKSKQIALLAIVGSIAILPLLVSQEYLLRQESNLVRMLVLNIYGVPDDYASPISEGWFESGRDKIELNSAVHRYAGRYAVMMPLSDRQFIEIKKVFEESKEVANLQCRVKDRNLISVNVKSDTITEYLDSNGNGLILHVYTAPETVPFDMKVECLLSISDEFREALKRDKTVVRIEKFSDK